MPGVIHLIRVESGGPTDQFMGQSVGCGCKHSQNAPFCDGAHSKLPK